MRRILPVVLLGFLSGCEDTLSAQPFVSDRQFRAALPSAERHTLDVIDASDGYLGMAPPVPGTWPDLVQLSLDVGGDLNGITLACLELMESAAATEPSYRSETSREWGPFEGTDRVTYSVEVERRSDTYTWDLRSSAAGANTLERACAGEHLSGAVALADGTGTLDISLEAWPTLDGAVGNLYTEYDLTDGQQFRIEIDGLGGPNQRAEDGRYFFRHRPGGAGDFQYRTTILLDGEYEGLLEVRTRWQSDRRGRSDAVVWIESSARRFSFSQCFTEDDRFAWRWTDFQDGGSYGDAAQCVHETAAAVDEI
ncbi:MAG TPA: hypothetical protein DFR83_12745 [Deltaproteobacteria bacterium]|nr:hypothetical protein [Deltaproteobacteria bacterium]